jgi:hypothetical protein
MPVDLPCGKTDRTLLLKQNNAPHRICTKFHEPRLRTSAEDVKPLMKIIKAKEGDGLAQQARRQAAQADW